MVIGHYIRGYAVGASSLRGGRGSAPAGLRLNTGPFFRWDRPLHAPMRKSIHTDRYSSETHAERRNPALLAGG